MPFELGLGTALSLAAGPRHDRYVFATAHRLVQRVASDLGGADIYEHRGTARGVIDEHGRVTRYGDIWRREA